MASTDPKIGNTLVTYEVTFRGDPFGSGKANALLLAERFPDGKPERSDTEGGGNIAAVAIKVGPKGPRGTLIKCSISSDTIQIQYLFPPQTLESLAKHIAAPEEGLSEILSALCKTHSLDTPPATSLSEWSATTQNVPCVGWLRKQLQLKTGDMNTSNYAPKGTGFDWKTIRIHFALNVTPPEIESYPEAVKEQLRTLSTFSVFVNSDDDWEADRGVVSATLIGVMPGLYAEFLRAVTRDRPSTG